MKRIGSIALLFCMLALIPVVHASPDSNTISLIGDMAKPGDWTLDRIKTELSGDITSLNYAGHDSVKHVSAVVPLASLLKAAGVDTSLQNPPKKVAATEKHGEMHYMVTVQGRDGYYAVFSIAELMADLGNRHIWLAIDVDSKPWPAADAPMKLIVSDDQKMARWVHAVQTISVAKITAPATQPAK